MLIWGGVTLGRYFDVNVGRPACEACSATWDLGANSAFAVGLRKTTENSDRVEYLVLICKHSVRTVNKTQSVAITKTSQ